MNVLEKILEEVENHAIEFEAFGVCDDYVSVGWIKEIISSHMSEKEKVSSAEIISRDIGGKPYYEIKYKKVGEDHYTVGYSSYFLDYVIDWLNNYFEFCGEPKIVVDVGKDTNVPSNDGWIPIEERLPEPSCDVLVQWEKYERYTDTIYTYMDKMWFDSMDENGNAIFETIGGTPNGKIIAWQPLPEPYRPEKGTEE